MSPSVRTPLATAVALAITLSFLLPQYSQFALSAVLLLCVLLFSRGWAYAVELPSKLGSAIIIAVTGILTLGLTLWHPSSWSFSTLMTVVLAVSMFTCFIHQMVRKDRRNLTISLSGTMAGALIASTAATWLETWFLIQEFGLTALRVVLLLAFAATISLLVLSLPIPGRFRIPSQLILAIAITILLAYFSNFAMTTLIATGLGAVSVSVGILSCFFLLERLVGVYSSKPYLALSTAPLLLVGIVPVAIIRLLERFMPEVLSI